MPKALLDVFDPAQKQLMKQKRVFKFYHASAETFVFHKGSVRIGTLQKYVSDENKSLQDQWEGSSITTAIDLQIPSGLAISDYVHPTSPVYDWLKHYFHETNHGNTVIKGVQFAKTFDFYIYSFTYTCDEAVQRSFDLGTPFDIVAEITDIEEFAEDLVLVNPHLKGMHYCIAPVIYRVRERTPAEEHPEPLVQAFEKPEAFKANNEGRIVFVRPVSPTSYVNNPRGYNLNPLPLLDDFASSCFTHWFKKGVMPSKRRRIPTSRNSKRP